MNLSPLALRQALVAFRRDQALSYLRQLSGGAPSAPPELAALRFLTSERGLSGLAALRETGALAPSEYGAACMHVARAAAEARYAAARRAELRLGESHVRVEGDERTVARLLGEWTCAPSPSQRARIARGLDEALGRHAGMLIEARGAADEAVAQTLAFLKPEAPPDAGPGAGAARSAESWLAASAAAAKEAWHRVGRLAGADPGSGLEALWASFGSAQRGLFPPEGRFRRVADELDPWGLRRLLSAHARVGAAHGGPRPAPHVIVRSAPEAIVVAPSRLEVGLASELLAADAVGRACGHAHASPGLAPELRHASAASLSRAFGAVTALRLAEPGFLRRVRGLSLREAGEVARTAAAFALADSRLAAAAVLARNLSAADGEAHQALAERALLGSVPEGAASFLLVRLSPGAPFRAKSAGFGLVWALRELYDEDWYRNPRAGRRLHGALLQAGSHSVEALCEDLRASTEQGVAKLSELF